jgi:hypothetical protein
MKAILLTGASILALGIAPLAAQEPPSSSGQPNASRIEGGANDRGADEPRIQRHIIRRGADRGEGPARDAMGDPSVRPGASADVADDDPWNGGIPFPPQDVSDQDLEPYGRDYPTAPPRRTAGANDDDDAGFADDTATLWDEGEQVPEDIERYQGPDMWEGDGAADVDGDEGPSSLAERRRPERGERLSSERGSSYGWDGRGVGRRFDRGELNPDRSETGAVGEADSERAAREQNPRAARESMEQDSLEERRLRLARIALRTARHALPEARFESYEFEIENDRRVIEIAGTDLENGKRVEVDVYPNGRVHSISEAIDLDAVPESVRSAVRSELGRFRVAQSLRSLRRDLDLYYEFAGFLSSGRPAVVEIRADGQDMSVRYLDQS